MSEQQRFIDKIKDGAIRGWEKYQVLPSLTIAQGALESGFGKSRLAQEGNNLFGIKGSYKGSSITITTKEQMSDGSWITVDAEFAKYPDWATSVEEHGAFFSSTEWRKDNYKHVFGETDYKKAVRAILPPKANAGYATDKLYDKKIIDIIEVYNLTRYDEEAVINNKEEDKVVKKNRYTIFLDIGHGSNTFPSSGKGVYRNGRGYAEHDFNSKLAISLKAKLEASGFTVVYGPQRPNSPDVALITRTNWANRNKVDLLVSIHANAGTSSVSGRCVFYWGTSTKGKQVATLIRDEIKAKGYSTHGSGLHASVRGSWTNLHMVRETKMPAVLIEHGFMTNSADFELIFGSKQGKYVEDMADADARAIAKYFGVAYGGSKAKPATKPATPSTSVSGKTLHRVQTGAFGVKKNAEDLVSRLKKDGFDAIVTFDGKLYRVQVGAYSVEDNAKAQLKKVKDKGYVDAFITTNDGQFVHTNDGSDAPEKQPTPKKKTLEQVAQEIVSGVHSYGNFPARKTRVEAEGLNYEAVQKRVDQILKGGESKLTVDSVAREIASGNHSYGNYPERKRIIESKGLNYNQVQNRVNQLLGSGAPKPAPKAKSIKVGSKVKIKSSASRYVTDEKIPNSVKGKTYTVHQMRKGNSEALLREIMSWVYVKDLQ